MPICRALGRDIDVEWVGVSVWTRRGVVAERYSAGAGSSPRRRGTSTVPDRRARHEHRDRRCGGSQLEASRGDRRMGRRWPSRQLRCRAAADRRTECPGSDRLLPGPSRFERGVEAIEDATAEGDEIRKRLGEQLLRDIARMFRTIGVQLGYRYDPSPICVPDGTPPPGDEPEIYVPTARPGSRAPHVWLDPSTRVRHGRGPSLGIPPENRGVVLSERSKSKDDGSGPRACPGAPRRTFNPGSLRPRFRLAQTWT